MSIMSNRAAAWFVFAAVLIALISGSARGAEGLTSMEAAAKYSDLAKEIEGRLAAGAQADTTLLGPLCKAYGELKNYAKLFDCLGRLQTRIKQGDVKIKADYWIPSASADARPLPGMLSAEAFLEIGQYDKAIAAGLEAMAALPPNNMDLSVWTPIKYRLSILPILAVTAATAGDREAALKYTKQLEDTSIPFMGSALTRPIKNNGLARAYMAIGAYDKALDNLGSSGLWNVTIAMANVTNSFAYRGESLGTSTELPRLLMRSKALAETGKRSEAKAILDSLLPEVRLNDLGEIHWIALFERGRLAEADGQLPQASALYQRAVELIEQQRSTLNTEAGKIGFVGDKQAVYARLVSTLIEQSRFEEAFGYVERSKSRALVDLLASKQGFATQDLDPEKVKRILAQLDSAELASHVKDTAVNVGERSSERSLQTLRQQIRSDFPDLSTLVSVTSVPVNELKALVGEDETLVEYYYEGKDLYVFVIDHGKLQAVKLDAGGLSEQVQAFRRAIEDPTSTRWQSSAQALYERLWKPIEGMLVSRKVILVAHGALHYLPFAALQKPDGSLLIDQYTIRFLPSASVLKFLRPVFRDTNAPMLVLGNPDLGDPKFDLQFAGDEARLVAEMNVNARLLLRKNASETNFKKAGSIFSRVHFATHGKFQADDPLASGLYLAKDAENDGVLTVGELYSMRLDADLVTLSACETGLGKVTSGDDVVGLTRGFLFAGTRSIVASLWSVDDKATEDLMKAFYENLKTMNKEEALRQAQTSLRLRFPHPFFWAAFQLTGRAN